MADISITASAVRGTRGDSALASVTLAAGNVVYRDSTTSKFALSDSNVVAAASVNGVCLNGADADQPCNIATSGNVTINAVLTAGTVYYLSATPGKICPLADLTTGSRLIMVGYAISTTLLTLHIVDLGTVL